MVEQNLKTIIKEWKIFQGKAKTVFTLTYQPAYVYIEKECSRVLIVMIERMQRCIGYTCFSISHAITNP